MTTGLTGRRTLITGGARGLGYAIAARFIESGAAVVLADLDDRAVRDSAVALGCGAVTCDVSVAADCGRAVTVAAETLGGLDVLINCAGIESVAPLAAMSKDEFDRVFAVNVGGTLLCTQSAIPELARGGGVVINIASTIGLRGCPLMGAYSASKSAVLRLTETFAIELRELGIRVNALCPGSAGTAMMARIGEQFEEAVGLSVQAHVDRTQGGRLVEPSEIADFAAFLASDHASAINGGTHVIDLGANASSL